MLLREKEVYASIGEVLRDGIEHAEEFFDRVCVKNSQVETASRPG
jgi:hypothetical protein